MADDNILRQQRVKKSQELRDLGLDPYPSFNGAQDKIGDILARYASQADFWSEDKSPLLRTAGRLMTVRDFGKSLFFHVQDGTGRMQGYLKKDQVDPETFGLFKKLDIGDFVGLAGSLFRTKTGELTLLVKEAVLLSKALLPLPEKFHGLTDVEQRYRQRYLDLLVNPAVRQIFETRSRIISLIRSFMNERGFLEVETPMMQPIPGGATAKPFKTYHNTLDMPLFLRIAPELYLKRLVIGGLERVFEINRNFRNEGISIQHNPEFTMMEFYQAYATYQDLMAFTELLVSGLASAVRGTLTFPYQGESIDLTPPWRKITFLEALQEIGGLPAAVLADPDRAVALARDQGAQLRAGDGPGKALTKIFEQVVEPKLRQPTFVTGYPIEVSPLAKRSRENPELTDRFELFISGREIANGFTELNDPLDQRERFLEQMKAHEAGDDEAQVMDRDYVQALEYGLPPTAGEGIGIDRLVMLLTDAPSIREVILFPQLRPEN
ncbi:MAG: lysine--tRNA ligase [Deltaproteobacteria bacterium]|nr:lysine--tRNA ligase [Deltaproteobacteria bacterium]